jgi:hypothetical protein
LVLVGMLVFLTACGGEAPAATPIPSGAPEATSTTAAAPEPTATTAAA